ncbi:hypothetical protein F4815DRAFT_444095 [Daldinia loculata]|nr:hypothetical protein F4815DRAFT_444095 [Daldinia loculata]
MNVSASLRASFYGPNGLLGLPPQSKRDTMAGDVKALRWQEVNRESIFEVEQAPEPPTIGDQIATMFTI